MPRMSTWSAQQQRARVPRMSTWWLCKWSHHHREKGIHALVQSLRGCKIRRHEQHPCKKASLQDGWWSVSRSLHPARSFHPAQVAQGANWLTGNQLGRPHFCAVCACGHGVGHWQREGHMASGGACKSAPPATQQLHATRTRATQPHDAHDYAHDDAWLTQVLTRPRALACRHEC